MADDLKNQLDEIMELENQLHQARHAARERDADVRRARGVVAERIHAWQSDGETALTPEQNVRQWMKSNQEARARRAAGLDEPVQRPRARSYMDRVGSYAFQGDGNDFARSRMQRGFRRGAMTQTQAAHANAARARAAKPPSER